MSYTRTSDQLERERVRKFAARRGFRLSTAPCVIEGIPELPRYTLTRGGKSFGYQSLDQVAEALTA